MSVTVTVTSESVAQFTRRDVPVPGRAAPMPCSAVRQRHSSSIFSDDKFPILTLLLLRLVEFERVNFV